MELPRLCHIREEKASNHLLFHRFSAKRSVEIPSTDGCVEQKSSLQGAQRVR